MRFLHWLGGIVVFFWVLGLIFKIAGSAIHALLIVAAVVYLYDILIAKKK